MEIPSKINIDASNIPSIIGGTYNNRQMPLISFEPVSFVTPTIPDFPPFIMPEFKLPPCELNLPPILFGQPSCISKSECPQISITIPPIPTINIFVQSPGTTHQEFLAMKEKAGVQPTTQEKSEAILRKLVELANEGKSIGFEKDFGNWTMTVTKDKMHTHVGIPGKDGSFDILVNNLYDLLIKGKGLSWA
jgi:hypothetical protein